MLIGKIVDTVCLEKTLPEAREVTFIRTQVDQGREVIAYNAVDAARGDRVLLCVGDGAWRSCESCPVDAVAVGIIGGNCG